MNLRRAPERALAALALLIAAPFAAHAAESAYLIQPGDVLSVSVWREPTLQGPVLVRPDGGFSFPLAGEIDARQKSVSDIQKLLSERLKRYISASTSSRSHRGSTCGAITPLASTPRTSLAKTKPRFASAM